MALFQHKNRMKSERATRYYAAGEILHTAVDFTAATAFLAGLILFFWRDLPTEGTWLFLIGSLLFAMKPTTRLVR